VFSDTKFDFNPDYVLPCIIYLDIKNQIIVKNDTFTYCVNSIIIKLEGITAHAGEPEKDQSCDGDRLLPNSTLLFRLTFQRKLLPDYPYLY
jgi:hypothetical protein